MICYPISFYVVMNYKYLHGQPSDFTTTVYSTDVAGLLGNSGEKICKEDFCRNGNGEKKRKTSEIKFP